MKSATLTLTVVFVTSCSGAETSPPPSEAVLPATSPTTVRAGDTTSTGTIIPSPETTTTTQSATTSTTAVSPTTTSPATADPVTHVTSPGEHLDTELVIQVAFLSQVPDVTSAELESPALAILNAPHWVGPEWIHVRGRRRERTARGPRRGFKGRRAVPSAGDLRQRQLSERQCRRTERRPMEAGRSGLGFDRRGVPRLPRESRGRDT